MLKSYIKLLRSDYRPETHSPPHSFKKKIDYLNRAQLILMEIAADSKNSKFLRLQLYHRGASLAATSNKLKEYLNFVRLNENETIL